MKKSYVSPELTIEELDRLFLITVSEGLANDDPALAGDRSGLFEVGSSEESSGDIW